MATNCNEDVKAKTREKSLDAGWPFKFVCERENHLRIFYSHMHVICEGKVTTWHMKIHMSPCHWPALDHKRRGRLICLFTTINDTRTWKIKWIKRVNWLSKVKSISLFLVSRRKWKKKFHDRKLIKHLLLSSDLDVPASIKLISLVISLVNSKSIIARPRPFSSAVQLIVQCQSVTSPDRSRWNFIKKILLHASWPRHRQSESTHRNRPIAHSFELIQERADATGC